MTEYTVNFKLTWLLDYADTQGWHSCFVQEWWMGWTVEVALSFVNCLWISASITVNFLFTYSKISIKTVLEKICTDCNRSCLFLSNLKWRSESRPCFPVFTGNARMCKSIESESTMKELYQLSCLCISFSFLVSSIFRIWIHSGGILSVIFAHFLINICSYRQGWQIMLPHDLIYWKGLYQQQSGEEQMMRIASIFCTFPFPFSREIFIESEIITMKKLFLYISLFLSRIIYFSNLNS